MPNTRRQTKSSHMGVGSMTGVQGTQPISGSTASTRRRARTRAGSTQGQTHRVGGGNQITVDALVSKWEQSGAFAAEELQYARKFAGLAILTLF